MRVYYADNVRVKTLDKFLDGIDWNAPNVLLAIASLILLSFAAPKKKRFAVSYMVSAVLGAGGFLLSAWAGVLTTCMAFMYRLFQSFSKPWQAFLTVTSGLTIFTGLAWFIRGNDPGAASDKAGNAYNGILGWFTRIADGIADNAALGMIIFVAGAAGTVYLYWRMRMKTLRPYRGLGVKVNREQMYQGMVNPDLMVLPEQKRDPRRVFPAKMRTEKLDRQQGLCAYQGLVGNHPRWEPYRSGVQWEGDHIVPHAVGGATNFVNLQVLCADCNSAKSDKFGSAAVKAIQERWENQARDPRR